MSIRLFNIMGAAHSGPTILGVLRGSHPDVVCVGELFRWTLYPDEGARRGACGALVRDCAYWSQASRVWQAASPGCGDPDRIPAEFSLRVYEEWIVSCVQGWADWVVVAECDGRPAGYSAWKRPSAAEKAHGLPVGHYSIGAVDPDFFGRGVFSALTLEGMRLFPGVADWIEGPTHLSNVPVQRGYLRLGWRLADARHSFHKWLQEEA